MLECKDGTVWGLGQAPHTTSMISFDGEGAFSLRSTAQMFFGLFGTLWVFPSLAASCGCVPTPYHSFRSMTGQYPLMTLTDSAAHTIRPNARVEIRDRLDWTSK